MSTPARAPESLSARLMDFALRQPVGEVPGEVLDWTATRFADMVGVALGAAAAGIGTAGARLALEDAAPGPASVWGSGGRRTRAGDACLANGMLAHAIEYDDTDIGTMLHPSVVVVPTALAVGEQLDLPGREVLAAGAVGYEVSARLGDLVSGRGLQRRGFHPTSVLGIITATSVAARLFGLSHRQAVNAAGLAGSMASGLMEYLSDGSDAKQLHPGWAAHGAVASVRLARHGATGPATVLEGPSGIFSSFAGEQPAASVDAALAGLGQRWLGTRVAPKPYPAGHCVHAAVDAWRALRERVGLSPVEASRIRRITALVPSAYRQLVCEPLAAKRAPRTVYDARFSLPFSLALAVVDGELGLDSYRAGRLSDTAVLAMAERVDYAVLEYPEYPAAFPGGVRVELDDGASHEEHVRYNTGSRGNPMSADQLGAKFRDGAGRLAPGPAVDRLLASLHGLGGAPSTAEFTAAMAAFDAVLPRG